MKKAKILHLITRSIGGGAQDNTFYTCELHDRERFAVHLACEPTGQWVDRARRVCDVFHPIPSLVTPVRPWQDLKALGQIIRLLRRERFDLIHTHTAKAGFLGRLAAWLCGVPAVVHTYHAFPFHDFLPAWKHFLYLTLERLAQPMTHFTITHSERDREKGSQLKVLRRADSRTVYSGIDFAKLDRAATPLETRRRLGISPDCQIVITAARLEACKAPHLLVEAFSEARKTHPNTVLLFAGDGELRPLVEERIRQLNLEAHVRLLGFRDDVPDLLRAADVFAFSSLWEALGRALTEAMLLGKAVVAPDLNGIPEIVRHAETGLLYEVGRVDQLASHLTFLLGHPEENIRLGENARRLTRTLFDVRKMVASIEAIYGRLLADQRPTEWAPTAETEEVRAEAA